LDCGSQCFRRARMRFVRSVRGCICMASISYTANDVTSKADWSSVQSIMDTDKFVIFVLPNQQEIPLPKHSFKSGEQYTEFMALVKLKLSK